MMRVHLKPKAYFSMLALLLVVVPVVLFDMIGRAAPIDLQSRYVRIDSPLADKVTNYHFGFTINSVSVLGSIRFEFCTNSPQASVPCTAPVGFSASTATLGPQTGAIGFSMQNPSANLVILTRTPSGNLPGASTYQFNNVHNPHTASETVYVRIATYASTDTSGPVSDNGAVAFATAVGIGVGAYVPPYLTFCVAVTVANDCSNAQGFLLDMGELLTNNTRAVTSQFAGATNDFTGYAVTMQGTTMTSGNNVITPLAAPTPSVVHTSQYGLNLRANSSPSVGQDRIGAGTLVPSSDYNTPNRYKFGNDVIATSPLSTEFNTMTVSYIVNIPDKQPPGIYNTTITYIATAAF